MIFTNWEAGRYNHAINNHKIPYRCHFKLAGCNVDILKPVRKLAPELAGVTFVNEHICVEEMRQAKDAIRWYADAMSFVRSSGGDIHANPRALFCSTLKYSQSF
ncbi:MAG: hypothetical protein HHJ09_10645 [Glaciimonas sp.]|nr:hypothetical protein [Glaciimonas sp.]